MRAHRVRRAGTTCVLCALPALGALGMLASGPAQAAPARTVAIEAMRFEPASVTARRGERIVWVNRDLVPHTVTHAGFDSGPIAPGARWTWVARAGRYDYTCTLHPGMRGRVAVK